MSVGGQKLGGKQSHSVFGKVIAVAVALAAVLTAIGHRNWMNNDIVLHLIGKKTVTDRIVEYGPTVRERLAPSFERAGVSYPPSSVVLLGLKKERRLDVYAAGTAGRYRFIKTYPFHAASGILGPKMAEGDYQVPEGIYPVEELNPNSLFHVALRVGYPNAFDLARAEAERRTNLGGDIMIHGGAKSVGCLAMGDPAAEDLFVLAGETGIEHVSIVISPVDFRRGETVARTKYHPAWLPDLYSDIRQAMTPLPVGQ